MSWKTPGAAWVRHGCLVLFGALAACDGGGPGGDVGDLLDIRLRPDLTLGVLEGPEEEVFGRIAGLLGHDDGRIFIADNQSSTIRVFGSDGDFLASMGGRGEGPGELDGPCCLAWGPTGLLWVRDGGNGRHSAFDVDAEAVTYSRSLRFEHGDVNLWVETTFTDDGRLIDVGRIATGSPPISEQARIILGESGGGGHPPMSWLGRPWPSRSPARSTPMPPYGAVRPIAGRRT